MIKNIKWLFLVSLTFVACSKSEDAAVDYGSSDGMPLTAGSANFSKYVALGNSLTAGFSDGALFIEGQNGSWSNVLANQFKLVGGGDFKIPFMVGNKGGFCASPGVALPASFGLGVRKYFNGCVPSDVSGVSETVLGSSIAVSGQYFNNCGVPGAKSFHLLSPSYGNAAGIGTTANPYYVRFAPNGTTSVLAYAMSQTPTFFSLWIGNNDVLGYALKGGDATLEQITPSAGAAGVGFDATYDALVNTLTSAGAKGVIANIPYVTTIPMFTSIPVKPVAPNTFFQDANEPNCTITYPTSAGDIATINSINTNLIGPLKQILTLLGDGGRVDMLSTTSGNPLLIKDESLTDLGPGIAAAAAASGNATLVALGPFLGAFYGKARHTKTGDLTPLTTRGDIGSNATVPPAAAAANLNKYGITFPLEDKHVLIPAEITELKTATDAFNVKIQAVATAKGLAFVDANALMTQIANGGISANGYTVTSAFVTGGGFSLDGVHPSPRGYALIANNFIKAINEKYGSNLKGVDISNYRVLFGNTL